MNEQKDKKPLATNAEDLALQRVKEVKQSSALFEQYDKTATMLRPRARGNNPTPSAADNPNIIGPSGKIREQFMYQYEKTVEVSKPEIIRPRKKSQQNIPLSDLQKQALEQTVTTIQREIKEKDKTVKKEEKRLLKERARVVKKVERLQTRMNRLIESGASEDEITKTVEIQNNYVAAMKEINQHIRHINSDYDVNMSLGDRRRQIYQNANTASTERAQRLMYIRELEKEGKSLPRGSKGYDAKSFYHKQLEDSKKSDYMKIRNPYYERLQSINDNGGITEEQEQPLRDRIAERWNAKKNNYDKNGRLKINKNFNFDSEDEK